MKKRDLENYLLYYKDLLEYKKQSKGKGGLFKMGKSYPCLRDRFMASGSVDGHYFLQDLYVANRIFLNNPEKHVDIGSRIDGFVSHVASFRKLLVIDVRPIEKDILNVEFIQADFMEPNRAMKNYTDSVSCLHAIEHFGLGRYGDPVDYDGYLKGLASIEYILKQGGKFYFSVPIGEQRVEFNAHRVFSVQYLLSILKKTYQVDCFSYIDDSARLHTDVELESGAVENSFGCNYGCGIFELTKT